MGLHHLPFFSQHHHPPRTPSPPPPPQLFYPEYEFAVVQCTNPDASKQLLSSSSEHESIPLSTVCATLYNNNNSSLVELTTTCSIQEVIGRPESVETAISALEYMSVGILSVMLLEIGFTVAVVGRAWVTVLHLLDLAVVLASLVLEIVLKAQPQLRQTLSLLIIVRMWTVVRLFEGIQEANEMAHAAEQEKQREELVRLRAEVERLRGDDNHLV